MSDVLARKDAERAIVIKKFVSFGSSIYVLPLYLLFAIADYVWYRDFFEKFLLIRVASVFIFLGLSRLVKRQELLGKVEITAALFVVACCAPIQTMLYLLPDADSPYYAGLVLILVGIATGLRLTWKFYAISMATILLPFLLIGLAKVDGLFSSYFLLNATFLISVGTIATVGRYFFESLNDKEFFLRLALEDEIVNRDKIIDRKTVESIRLKSLSKQFSPQIVKSINDGVLNLQSDLYESQICAIFIDIKDSTKKMLELDSKQIQKIISSYVEDVMGLMLKYDITVDKFLGDGVMGFSNNPVKHDDYVERVVRCAFEMIERLESKSSYYEQYWGGPFEVRIGISSGSAAVGFYGSDLHVKSYTAIGKVINLAARINGVAPENGIVLTEEVIAHLNTKKSRLLSSVTFLPVKQITLKGFESEQVVLYEAKSLFKNESHNHEEDLCPNGHGPLFLDNNENGIYVLKCRDCEYVLDDQKTGTEKKAA